MKKQVARYFVEWITSPAERIFFVYGMRRAGNHACVGWLANALEGQTVDLYESRDVTNFNYSASGRTFFINDIPTIHSSRLLKRLYSHASNIRRAKFIIISAEDKDASYANDWRIPRRSEPIQVRRGTLNLIASRYQNLNRRARDGWGASMQSMRPNFFATLKANLEQPAGVIWELEHWHDDDNWRHTFLATLGLNHDSPPPVVGLGSSFSTDRAMPADSEMHHRFAMVEPRDAWLAFIKHAASEHPDLFSADEHAAICTLTPT